MLEVVVLSLVIVLVLWLKWQSRGMSTLSKQLKSSIWTLPFVGHSYLFIGNDEDRMKTFQRLGNEAIRNGGLTSLWHANYLYAVVADPIIAEIVLRTCLEKDDLMKLTKILIGNGSIFAPVSIWRPRRKILAPTFSLRNLNKFLPIFTLKSVILTEKLKNVVDKGPFSIWNYFTSYTMDSVCETTLGYKVNTQPNSQIRFVKAFEICCQINSKRMCQPWLHNDTVYKMLPEFTTISKHKNVIIDFIDRIIKSKRISIKEQHSKTECDQNKAQDGLKTFLELLIDQSGGDRGYTDLELQEETLVIVLAGTDTSAVGASFVSVLLSRHQDVQEKVYKELREVLGASDKSLAAEDLPRLKYLDAVIKETLRLYPPVPVITRKVDKDLVLPSGITLVPGCGIMVNIWAIHRNQHYWGSDADQFKPDRFIGSTLKHPAAFIPFSHGPRSCLGSQYAMMSTKVALAALLRQYRILPSSEAAAPEDVPERVKFDIMMKHVDNFRIKIEER